ncbi:MAG TPA: tetratricopeptide repeat protein [Pyrinomonadaceae bacterium]|jgi:tetratricopeptide (TPR) repeat protein|nr:tetratricopeptide repeat protein [Pyrinomonadaceae bacterium]
MKRIAFSLAVSVCLFLVVSQHTPVVAKDTWVSVRTKNFLMLGNASEKEIKSVGLKLEQFREAFTNMLPSIRFNTPVPTTVIVFKSDSSYAPFKPGQNVAGYFQPGPDVNYITLTTEVRGQQDPFTVIFHEYTHLLVNNTFASAPVWFNEGLAEYYSTFSITDDQKVVLGSPIASHVYKLRESKMLPLKTLFEVDQKSPHYNERDKQSIFYAESWALMHYLIVGKEGRAEKLGKFLELMDTKIPVEQAFQQAFGVPFDSVEKDLRTYVRQDRYNVVRGHFEKKLEFDNTIEAVPLTDAEVQAYLGDLLLHSNRADAYTYLQKAVKLDPNLAMAHASLGMAYFREGKVDEAYASLERAVAANSQNYLAHYYYAFTLSRSGPGNGPTVTGYPAEITAKIREHLEKAIALRPDYPDSYSLLAFVSLVTGKGIDESIVSLKKMLVSVPGRHDLTFMLAQLYLEQGESKVAREMLEQVVKSNAEEQVRHDAAGLLSQVSSFEKAKQEDAEDEKTPAPAEPSRDPVVTETVNKPSPPPDPSAYLREVLRQPAAGETQLQGTLLRLECDPKGIVFVVQAGTSLLKLRAASFDDMELTTYDTSVKGEITCGERKPANAVVVAYLPNTDKKLKIDGVLKSIEFVPADFKLKPAP